MNSAPAIRNPPAAPSETDWCDRVRARHQAGWFTMVEIEINSRCNRACPYCPNVITPRNASKFIFEHSFTQVFDRLAEAGFIGRLSYHFYGEPLLHPKLAQTQHLAFSRPSSTVLSTGLNTA
jgi:sulfatase maturation enzyme AslB (radical SAM superfamily)